MRHLATLSLLCAAPAVAQPIPIPELTDEDLSYIDLRDGSVADWTDVVAVLTEKGVERSLNTVSTISQARAVLQLFLSASSPSQIVLCDRRQNDSEFSRGWDSRESQYMPKDLSNRGKAFGAISDTEQIDSVTQNALMRPQNGSDALSGTRTGVEM